MGEQLPLHEIFTITPEKITSISASVELYIPKKVARFIRYHTARQTFEEELHNLEYSNFRYPQKNENGHWEYPDSTKFVFHGSLQDIGNNFEVIKRHYLDSANGVHVII